MGSRRGLIVIDMPKKKNDSEKKDKQRKSTVKSGKEKSQRIKDENKEKNKNHTIKEGGQGKKKSKKKHQSLLQQCCNWLLSQCGFKMKLVEEKVESDYVEIAENTFVYYENISKNKCLWRVLLSEGVPVYASDRVVAKE